MKKVIFLILFSLTLTMYQPVLAQVSNVPQQEQVQTQQPAPDAPQLGFFQKIWNNAKDSGIWVLVMYVAGILSKNGVTKTIKLIAGKTTIVTKELSDVSLSVSNFAGLVDNAIKNDGSVDQNSLKEAAAAGKTVMVEAKEAWVQIIPKKPIVTPS